MFVYQGSHHHPSLAQMLCNAKSKKFKTMTLQDYIEVKDMDLKCTAKTWTRGDKIVSLKELTPTSSFIIPGLRGGGSDTYQ